MDEKKDQLADEETMESASVAPPDPEERAFTGHPDHPPASPDQPVDGNQELLRSSSETEEVADEQGAAEAEGHPS